MLYPLNNYLVVKPVEEVKKQSGVLVPEGYVNDESAYSLVEVAQPNVNSNLSSGMRILVPSHLVEEASFFGEVYYLVSENHVIGFYGED